MSITRIKTWVDGEQLTAEDLNAEFDAMATGLPAATQSEVNAGTSTTTGLTPNHFLTILGTETGTTSGTSVTASSSIPAGTRRITLNFVGVSSSGTSNWILQLGDSGGIEPTGYLGACTTIAGATPSTSNFTTGFGLTNAVAAASVAHGTITLTLEDSVNFTWCCAGVLAFSNAATTNITAGSKSLSAELTTIQITTAGGADTFDAGSINITYGR